MFLLRRICNTDYLLISMHVLSNPFEMFSYFIISKQILTYMYHWDIFYQVLFTKTTLCLLQLQFHAEAFDLFIDMQNHTNIYIYINIQNHTNIAALLRLTRKISADLNAHKTMHLL